MACDIRRAHREIVCFTQRAAAQNAVAAVAAPVDFGDLAAGPYKRLVIRGAMVSPAQGGPPNGSFDIVIEENTITQVIAFDP